MNLKEGEKMIIYPNDAVKFINEVVEKLPEIMMTPFGSEIKKWIITNESMGIPRVGFNFSTVGDCDSFIHPELGEIEIEIDKYVIDNNGIGAYEYHGQKCNDRGVDAVVVESLSILSIGGKKYLDWIPTHKKLLWALNNLDIEINVDELPEYYGGDY